MAPPADHGCIGVGANSVLSKSLHAQYHQHIVGSGNVAVKEAAPDKEVCGRLRAVSFSMPPAPSASRRE